MVVEVRLVPGVHGCISVPLAILTLGLLPILMRMGERHFIARVHAAGFESRGGARVAWSELQRVERVVGKVRGMRMSDEYLFYTTKGRFSLPSLRMDNAQEVMTFIEAHAPRPS
jgi:hypothetical protein